MICVKGTRRDPRQAAEEVAWAWRLRRENREEGEMVEKKVEIKPTRKASKDLKDYASRARSMREKFAAEGRRFSDSSEIIRFDRDSR